MEQTMRAGLIVVDMQEDFCPPDGALAVKDGRGIVAWINVLLSWPGWRVRVATRDLHPQDHISFASNHPGTQPFSHSATIQNPENAEEVQESTLWPDHCVKGSPGAELIPQLAKSRLHQIVTKGEDRRVESYSAFGPPFRSPRMGQSNLEAVLQTGSGSKGPVDHVFVVGLAYDFCVKATAIDAVEAGYKTFVIEDATKAVYQDEESLNKTRSSLKEAGVQIITMDDEILKEVKVGSG